MHHRWKLKVMKYCRSRNLCCYQRVSNGEQKFVVVRRDAEPLVYTDIKQMHEDYENIVCSISQSIYTPKCHQISR